MPFNGSGGFNALAAPIFPAVSNTTIVSSYYNAQFNDVFSGLGMTITRDGQSTITANLPMGGFKHTAAAAATATGQYLVYGQAAAVLTDLSITGTFGAVNLALSGTLSVGGISTFTGAVNGTTATFSGAITAAGATINGAVTGITNLTTTGNTQLGDAVGDTLTVAGGSLRVDASGQVGVGAAPSSKFSVVDANGIPLRLGDISAAPTSQLACYVGTAVSGLAGAANGDLVIIPRTSSTNTVSIWTGNGTAVRRMTIDAAGATVFTGSVTAPSFIGNADSATILQTTRTINGVSFNGSANITVTAAAGTLTGATLAAGVTASSLTSLGILAAGVSLGNSAQAGANILDWYEEGSWTPTVQGTAVAGTFAYAAQIGRFVRVGRLVFVTIQISWSTIGAAAGFLQINGLPYAVGVAGNFLVALPQFNTAITADAWRAPLVAASTAFQLNGFQQSTGAQTAKTVAVNENWTIIGYYEV